MDPIVYRLTLWTAVLMLLPGIWAILRTTQKRPQKQARAATARLLHSNRLHPERFRIARLRVGPIKRAYIGLLVAISMVRILQVAGMAVSNTFFNVYMDQALNVPIAQIGLITSAARLMSVPAALAMAGMATRWGNHRLVIFAGTGTLLGLLPLALMPLVGAAAAGLFVISISSAIRYPAFLAYSMEMVREDQRQTMSGLSEMTAGISFACMALLGGYMITTVGYTALFLTGAFLVLLGTIFYVAYFNRPRGVAAQPPIQAPAGIGD
jgi:predicted MFS family arabinose efflux permease